MLKDKSHDDLGEIYLQTFATSGGLEILADLKRTFYNTSSFGKKQDEVLADGYRRDVVQHIIDKMYGVNKKAAAQIMLNVDYV